MKIIDAPTSTAIRHLAEQYMSSADKALIALQEGNDPEALHDFRVPLRRLRCLLKAYRRDLPKAGHLQKLLRQLGKLTNPARDCEVQLHWLMQLQQQLPISTACNDGLYRLGQETEFFRHRVCKKAPGLFKNLQMQLQLWLAKAEASSAPVFGDAASSEIQQRVKDFRAGLETVLATAENPPLHRTRIAGKYLRYLLEPLAADKNLISTLAALQDALGEIHDTQVLAKLLQDVAADQMQAYGVALFQLTPSASSQAAVNLANPAGELMIIADHLQNRYQQAWQHFRELATNPATAQALAKIEAVAAQSFDTHSSVNGH